MKTFILYANGTEKQEPIRIEIKSAVEGSVYDLAYAKLLDQGTHLDQYTHVDVEEKERFGRCLKCGEQTSVNQSCCGEPVFFEGSFISE